MHTLFFGEMRNRASERNKKRLLYVRFPLSEFPILSDSRPTHSLCIRVAASECGWGREWKKERENYDNKNTAKVFFLLFVLVAKM